MKISVVLSTYGRAAEALECIESILANGYSEFEILVIDQGPGRTLEEAIKGRYPNSAVIRYFFLDPPGLSRARNRGLKLSKGEIVAFIDDDALADRDWLAGIAATFIDREPRPALMGGRILPIWPGGRPRWLPAEREYLLGLYDIGDEETRFPGDDLPIGANMAGLRKVMLEVGGFDEWLGADSSRPQLPMAGEDSLLSQQIKDAGYMIFYQPRATVYHRISKRKVSPRFFLRRYFWEGVTVVTRMRLIGSITAENSAATFSFHIRSIVRSLFRLMVSGQTRGVGAPWSARAMYELTQMAYSIGVLYAVRRVPAARSSALPGAR